MIDTHCHILPGLDDGALDEEHSLEMARAAVSDGITGIVATPHDIPGLYSFDVDKVNEKLAILNNRLEKEGIKLLLYPGSEVALAPELEHRHANNGLLTIAGKGRHLLVELPTEEIPPYAGDVFYKLQLRGLTPVIAHPERNLAVLQQPAWVQEMMERGMLIQLSAPSITGLFGKKVQYLAGELARRGWVHLVASDAHSAGKRGPRLHMARKTLGGFLTAEALSWLFDTNPQLIVDGREVKQFEEGYWLKRKAPVSWLARLRGENG
ncbi:MAG: CpsB/CapC family capsule biosynthesis tyrosine phosphatase [Bacillota bacterium]